MPSVKEIHLICTPEEWEVLCTIWDFHANSDEPNEYYPHKPFDELKDKISAINKRLVFASSVGVEIRRSDTLIRKPGIP